MRFIVISAILVLVVILTYLFIPSKFLSPMIEEIKKLTIGRPGDGIVSERVMVQETEDFVRDLRKCVSHENTECICIVKKKPKFGIDYFVRLVKGPEMIKVTLAKGESGEEIKSGKEVEERFGAGIIKTYTVKHKTGSLCLYSESINEIISKGILGKWPIAYGDIMDVGYEDVWFEYLDGNTGKYSIRGPEEALAFFMFYKNKVGDICLVMGEANRLLEELSDGGKKSYYCF